MSASADFRRPCRPDFPVLERVIDGHPIVYLDSAATALKPRAVIDAVVDYYARVGANIHRGKHYLSEEASTRFEEARHRIAQFLGCMGNEVVFVRNTTEALGIVAHGLSLKREDLVVSSMDAHHSQLLPWRAVANVKAVAVDSRGAVDLDHFKKLLAESPKVVALTHCSNVTGSYAPIDEMIRLARAAGALTVIDAAQSVPHRKLDVAKLGCDFLAFSGHKLMGPTGIGVLFGRHELLETLPPLLHGGGTVDWVTADGQQLRKIPHRFEAGTPHIDGVLGLAAAVDYLEALGFAQVQAHDTKLSLALLDGAARRPWLTVLGPTAPTVDRAAILSLTVGGVHELSDVARMLSDSYGIMCRTGHFCAQPLVDAYTDHEALRASAYVYNTVADVDAFFTALDEIAETLGIRAGT